MNVGYLKARTVRGLSLALILLIVRQNSYAQIVKKPTPKSTKQTTTNSLPGETQPSPVASFEGKLVSVFDPENPDRGDYVPCQFTAQQLLLLRPKPEITVISSYDEEQIKGAVLASALSNSNKGLFNKGQETAFAKALATVSLEGLTMSQALAVVIDILNTSTAATADAQLAVQAAKSGKPAFNAYLKEQLPPNVYGYVSSGITATQPDELLDQTNSLVFDVMQQKPSAGNKTVPSISPAEHTQTMKVDQAVTEGKQVLSEASSNAKNSIVDSARNTIAGFQRPNDVGCAMSILSWNSVRYAFGQTLADEYIAVQIVVRNMNTQQEFLIHDAEFSVDSELSGAHGRYFSGLDKLTVRGFMLSSRDYGRRNFTVNLAQGAGTILSATTPVFGGALADASSVYNAGFLNALSGVWKDHNTEQLNLLNDVGFSASKTDRTVVPKSGTAMFVIFIPSKQFEEGWWTQECANVIVTSKETVSQKSEKKDSQKGDAGDATQSASTAVEPQDAYKKLLKYQSDRTGIDLDAARAICQHYYSGASDSSGNSNALSSDDFAHPSLAKGLTNPLPNQGPSNSSVTQGTTKINYIKSPNSVPYRKWSDTSYAIFRELAFAVVAGSHIQEQQDTTPSLTMIDCPKDVKGDIDFSKVSNGAISCSLTGQNLDKVNKLKFRNSQDASDTKTADGAVSSNGDPKSATASLPLDQIGPLNQKAYKVYTVTKEGAENGGSQIIHFNLRPILSGPPVPPEIPLDKLTAKGATNVSIKLKGYHLDNLDSVHLGKSEEELSSTDVLVNTKASVDSSTAGAFEVTPVDAAKVPPGDYTSSKLKMYILLVPKDDPNTKSYSGQILYGSGDLKAPAAVISQLLLSLPKSAAVGAPVSVKITINDSTGAADAGFTGSVHVTSSDKQVSLPPDYTFKTTDKGTHSFSATFKTKGTQTVTVTSGAMTAKKSTIVK